MFFSLSFVPGVKCRELTLRSCERAACTDTTRSASVFDVGFLSIILFFILVQFDIW